MDTAVALAETMRTEAPRMDAPGAVWALIDRRAGDTVEAAGGLEPDTIFRIASVTKPIAAAATLTLVDDGTLSLDDDVARWVPAWGERRVLRVPDSPLDDTVAANRSTTVRDVLAMGFGLGYRAGAAADDPLGTTCFEAGLYSTWTPSTISPATWAERAAALPMAHQPGEGYLYQSSFDALTVIVEAASGRRFDEVLHERIFAPLRMQDTAYTVPTSKLHRVPANYFPGSGWVDEAPAHDEGLTTPPSFCSGATGLVSTAADLAKFARCLVEVGAGPSGRVLSLESVDAMRTDHLSSAGREMGRDFLTPYATWGLGVGLDDDGRFGWDGGTGTLLTIDPKRERAAVLLTRQGMGGESKPAYMAAFEAAFRG